jgi:beta-lactamase class A
MSPGHLDGLLADLRPDPSADYGLVVEDLGSDERIALNETRVFPSGSVYKLALAWQVLREVDLGRFELDQSLEIVPEDTIEDEPSGGLSATDTPTVRQALRAMFTVSSNAAAHALLRLIGRRDFNQAMSGVGLNATRVPDEPDGGEAVTTAGDVARLMRLIATQQGLSMPAQVELHGLLSHGGVPDALRETLADEVLVLDKTGNLEDASNVGALLFTSRGGVILVVLDQGVDPGDARGIIAQLGQVAYSAFLE